MLRQVGLLALACFSTVVSQDTPTSAPAVSQTPGSLSSEARSPPSGTSVCVFTLQGASTSSNRTVTAASISASSGGTELRTANIKCKGGSGNITIQGGPSLESFSGGWEGVSYIKNTQLPGSTMTLRGVNMVVQDSSFTGLRSFGDGAIVFAASNVTFLNTSFLLNNNSLSACIYANESSFVKILDSNFTSNVGLSAGSVALWNSTLTVNNTAFTNNTCSSNGGALMVNNGTKLSVTQSNFTTSNATNGGAIYFEQCTSVSVLQNNFVQNTASKSGGAFFQLQCPGTFLSNTFRQNSAANGGAIWHNNVKKLNLTLNLFEGNSAPKGSGGIELNQVESMVVNTCNFTGGKGSKGGAIYTQNTGGDIVNTYFAKNNASTSGGAIFRATSTGTISSSDFIGNTAAADGGAIYDSHVEGDIAASNSFSKNTAKGTGSAIFRTVSSGTVEGKGLNSSDSSAVKIDNSVAG